MTLTVHAWAYYPSYSGLPWRQADFNASMAVKAVKGIAFNGYGYAPDHEGLQHHFTMVSRQIAVDLWVRWAVRKLQSLGEDGSVLVGFPSSTTTAADQDYAAVRMAQAVVAAARNEGLNVTYARALYFNEPIQSAREGGSRDAAVILEKLRCTVTKASKRVILIDDVVTSGGHLVAATRLLRSIGAQVEIAICAGRTVNSQQPDMFEALPESIPVDSVDLWQE